MKKRSRTVKAIMILASVGFLLPAMAFSLHAQTVYGVAARRTTVVHTGSTRVVRSTTVVTSGHPVLPHGYIAALPVGYRVVTVRGGRYFVAGGVYYRASFYQGRTVYIRTTI